MDQQATLDLVASVYHGEGGSGKGVKALFAGNFLDDFTPSTNYSVGLALREADGTERYLNAVVQDFPGRVTVSLTTNVNVDRQASPNPLFRAASTVRSVFLGSFVLERSDVDDARVLEAAESGRTIRAGYAISSGGADPGPTDLGPDVLFMTMLNLAMKYLVEGSGELAQESDRTTILMPSETVASTARIGLDMRRQGFSIPVGEIVVFERDGSVNTTEFEGLAGSANAILRKTNGYLRGTLV